MNGRRFERGLGIGVGVEPRRFLQFALGVTAVDIDAVEVDGQRGMGGGGVFRVEIEAPLELAERAINPGAQLLIGKADGAGGGVHGGVFDGVGARQNAECENTGQRDETQYSRGHRTLRAGLP
ncbi:hypothetical protein D3C85_1506830 [compost metagenome]